MIEVMLLSLGGISAASVKLRISAVEFALGSVSISLGVGAQVGWCAGVVLE
jgi:hypothetical protein